MVDDRITRGYEDEECETIEITDDGHKIIKKKNLTPFSTAGNLYPCPLCKKLFKNPLIYRKHLKIHSENFICPLCSKAFVSKQFLITHMLSHAKTQHFQCHLCHKFFNEKGKLNQHLKFHSCKKPYKCRECGKDFFQQEHMKAHLRQHTNERPYQCEMCDKSFNIKSSLQRHMNCHTGAKPFICDICQRGYTRRSVLVLHVQQVHENKKPYQCSVCDMCFSQKGNLQAHFKRKHVQQKSESKKDSPKGKRGIRKHSFKHNSKIKKSQSKNSANSANGLVEVCSRTKPVKVNNSIANNSISLKLHPFPADSTNSNATEEVCITNNDIKVTSDHDTDSLEDNSFIKYFSLEDETLHNGFSDSSDSLPTFHNPYAFSNENLLDDVRLLSEFDMLLNEPTDWEDLLSDPDILDPRLSNDILCSPEKVRPDSSEDEPSDMPVLIAMPSCHDYACPFLAPGENGKSGAGAHSSTSDKKVVHSQIKIEVED